jgi:hypothetical protein
MDWSIRVLFPVSGRALFKICAFEILRHVYRSTQWGNISVDFNLQDVFLFIEALYKFWRPISLVSNGNIGKIGRNVKLMPHEYVEINNVFMIWCSLR